jgi:hypothetical protein
MFTKKQREVALGCVRRSGTAGTVWVVLALPVLLMLAKVLEAAPAVLSTGGSEPLHVISSPLIVDPNLSAPRLEFTFGFGTDEQPTPGQFLDSVSFTLQGANHQTALFFTADANQVFWAPPNPGGLTLSESEISRAATPFDIGTFHFLNENAFSVSVPIPDELEDQSPTLFFDLFDNENGVESLAYLQDVRVVPEPTSIALLSFFGCLYFISRRFFRRTV